jgi:hypothetical protein
LEFFGEWSREFEVFRDKHEIDEADGTIGEGFGVGLVSVKLEGEFLAMREHEWLKVQSKHLIKILNVHGVENVLLLIGFLSKFSNLGDEIEEEIFVNGKKFREYLTR